MFELMEDRTKTMIKIGIVSVLVIGIIVGGYYFYSNHKENNKEILYPDGCKEVLEDGKLITPICVNGRAMIEQQRSGGN